MPKQNCKNCGESNYLSELSSDGYCYECGAVHSEDKNFAASSKGEGQ